MTKSLVLRAEGTPHFHPMGASRRQTASKPIGRNTGAPREWCGRSHNPGLPILPSLWKLPSNSEMARYFIVR